MGVFIGSIVVFISLWVVMMSYTIAYYVFLHGMKKRYDVSLLDFELNGRFEGGVSSEVHFPYTDIPGAGIRLNLRLSAGGLVLESRLNNIDNHLAYEDIGKVEIRSKEPLGLIGGVLITHRSEETPNPLYVQRWNYRKMYRCIKETVDSAEWKPGGTRRPLE